MPEVEKEGVMETIGLVETDLLSRSRVARKQNTRFHSITGKTFQTTLKRCREFVVVFTNDNKLNDIFLAVPGAPIDGIVVIASRIYWEEYSVEEAGHSEVRGDSSQPDKRKESDTIDI